MMKPDVIVIGSGLSGLSAAVDLTSRGFSVLVLERSTHPGGRAYSFLDDETGEEIDNGQHLMMGCYHETRWLLRTIGSEHLATLQPNLHIDFLHPERGGASLHCASLSAPLHLLVALLKLKTLSLSDRLRLLRIGLEIQRRPESVEPSIANLSVREWLDSLGQPENSQKYLWDVIAVGSLNGDPREVSALLFYRVLRAAFLGERENSSLLIPRVGLSRLFDQPAIRYIEAGGGEVIQGCAANALITEHTLVQAVQCSDGVQREAGAFVSAVPWYALPDLLPSTAGAAAPHESMTASAILSINLWFDVPVMDGEFVALLDCNVQWVFNRTGIRGGAATSGQCLVLTVSGADRFVEMEAAELVDLAVEDLRKVFPRVGGARLVRSLVLKEKRATFSQRPGIEASRPSCITPLENFFLAGDWTNTGYPATIEGAVMSGRRAASQVSKFLLA